MQLMDHQKEAIDQLGNGKILYGEVGSGKTTAVIAYYVKYESPRDIVVITTARKRDSLDWEREAAVFGISRELSVHGTITVDSWNNIGNYLDRSGCFFVFDEQRVVGHGAWVKAFIKIARNNNHWVLLSATPGDTWLDYAPVFIANGFYKNITHFKVEHVRYEPYIRYPKVREYLNEERLEELRNEILIEMPDFRDPDRHSINWWEVDYDKDQFRKIWRDRWNVFDNVPVVDAAERWKLCRRLVNSDSSRLEEIRHLLQIHPRLIVFYNFDYELELLRGLDEMASVYEWNGHKKDRLEKFEDESQWIYLVQYMAGAEAWNCISTDAMVPYSLPYSYKLFKQSMGRIDRMNTKFPVLYYYLFVSNSVIDKAISESLRTKRTFNERKEIQKLGDMSDMSMSEFDLDQMELEAKYGYVDGQVLEVCQI